MQYQTTIKREGSYANLVFTRKSGEVKKIFLGFVKDGALADQCLGKLYDFHQCDDEFKEGDQILVPAVGTFEARSFHIMPADEDTKFAVMGVTRENPYRIAYDGIDGNDSNQFATIDEAVLFIKARWQGVEYMDSNTCFHTDYARYTVFGFTLKDIGKVTGQGIMHEFTFQIECPHPSIMGNSRSSECVKCGKQF